MKRPEGGRKASRLQRSNSGTNFSHSPRQYFGEEDKALKWLKGLTDLPEAQLAAVNRAIRAFEELPSVPPERDEEAHRNHPVIRPDVVRIYRTGRGQNMRYQIDITEVVSPSQSDSVLRDRIDAAFSRMDRSLRGNPRTVPLPRQD